MYQQSEMELELDFLDLPEEQQPRAEHNNRRMETRHILKKELTVSLWPVGSPTYKLHSVSGTVLDVSPQGLRILCVVHPKFGGVKVNLQVEFPGGSRRLVAVIRHVEHTEAGYVCGLQREPDRMFIDQLAHRGYL